MVFGTLVLPILSFLATMMGCGTTSSSSCLVNLGTDTDGAEREVRNASSLDYAQSFYLSSDSTVSNVSVYLAKTGTFDTTTGGDTLKIYLASDSGSTSPGTTLSSIESLSATDLNNIGTSSAYQKVTFDSSLSLSASTTYWVIVEGGYSANATKYVRWLGNSTNTYTSGLAMEKAAGVWSNVPDSSGTKALKDFMIRVGCD